MMIVMTVERYAENAKAALERFLSSPTKKNQEDVVSAVLEYRDAWTDDRAKQDTNLKSEYLNASALARAFPEPPKP